MQFASIVVHFEDKKLMCVGGFESLKISVVASVFSESLGPIADRITEKNLLQVRFCLFKMEREFKDI